MAGSWRSWDNPPSRASANNHDSTSNRTLHDVVDTHQTAIVSAICDKTGYTLNPPAPGAAPTTLRDQFWAIRCREMERDFRDTMWDDELDWRDEYEVFSDIDSD